MNGQLVPWLAGIIGYFLGSISFAVIIAKYHGRNIFEEGSGNPGATNVKRVLGSRAGNLCFFLDFLKGMVATALAFLPWTEWFGLSIFTDTDRTWTMVAGLAGALLGHSYSVFLKFRGGKGVASTVGGLVIILPWSFLVGIGVWLATFYTTRFVSLASILLGVSLPFSAWLLDGSPVKIGFSLLLAIVIVVRHKSNIQRLMAGTENRFAKKK